MEEEEESEFSISSIKFAQAIVEQVNRPDIEGMVQFQRDMLSRYEKTNEMLINFNLLSLSRYEATSQEFKKHTQVLYEMKKDLDNVFRRIRQLKNRLGSMYPEAFSFCSDVYNMMSDEDEEDSKNSDKTKHSSDQDSSVTADGMNEMLANEKNVTETNGYINCDKNEQNNIPSEEAIPNISNLCIKDDAHMTFSDNKHSVKENLNKSNCNEHNLTQLKDVVENG